MSEGFSTLTIGEVASIVFGVGIILVVTILIIVFVRWRKSKKTIAKSNISEMNSAEVTGSIAITDREEHNGRRNTKSVEFSVTDLEKVEYDEN